LIEQPVQYTQIPVDASPSLHPYPINGPVPDKFDSIQIRNSKTGLCITYKGNNSGLIGSECVTNNSNQQFKILYNMDSTYSIAHVESGQRIDLPSVNSNDYGANMWTFRRTNETSQRFMISNSTSANWTLMNSKSGKCLDQECRSLKGEFAIDQWECQKDSQSQQWTFVDYQVCNYRPPIGGFENKWNFANAVPFRNNYQFSASGNDIYLADFDPNNNTTFTHMIIISGWNNAETHVFRNGDITTPICNVKMSIPNVNSVNDFRVLYDETNKNIQLYLNGKQYLSCSDPAWKPTGVKDRRFVFSQYEGTNNAVVCKH